MIFRRIYPQQVFFTPKKSPLCSEQTPPSFTTSKESQVLGFTVTMMARSLRTLITSPGFEKCWEFTEKEMLGFHGISWMFHGCFMGFHGISWMFHGCFLGKSSYLGGWWVKEASNMEVSCRCSTAGHTAKKNKYRMFVLKKGNWYVTQLPK